MTSDLQKQTDGSVVGNPCAYRGEVVSAALAGAVAAAAVVARQLKSASEWQDYWRILGAECERRSNGGAPETCAICHQVFVEDAK